MLQHPSLGEIKLTKGFQSMEVICDLHMSILGGMVAGLECGKSKWVGRAWWTIQHKYITTTMLMYFEAKKSKDKELWCWRRKWGQKKECSICKSMVLIRGVEDHRDLRARFRIAGAITLRILLQSVLDYFFILCCIAFARTYKILKIDGANGHLILCFILRETASELHFLRMMSERRFL